MALEHEKAAKVVTRETIIANAIKAVKEGDTVSYVNENGIGREAKVLKISGEKADLRVILPDGQAVVKTGVPYVEYGDPEDLDENGQIKKKGTKKKEVTSTPEQVVTRKGPDGKEYKEVIAAKDDRENVIRDERGRVIPRDVAKVRDTAILLPEQGEHYWHV